ncbi:hypothetical protein ACSR0Z_22115 [Streptomyces viridosporus]
MNGTPQEHRQRVLAALALAADSPRADFDSFVDDLDADGLVMLVAGLADFGVALVLQGQQDPEVRTELVAALRARLAEVAAEDGK